MDANRWFYPLSFHGNRDLPPAGPVLDLPHVCTLNPSTGACVSCLRRPSVERKD